MSLFFPGHLFAVSIHYSMGGSTLRRRAFNLAATVSLVLCIATAGLWVHSQFRAVSLEHVASRDSGGFIRTCGAVPAPEPAGVT